MWEAVYQTMSALESRWWPKSWPETDVYHAYDPLPPAQFFAGLKCALPHLLGAGFMDIGCGIGTKLHLMWSLGYEVSGVERHAPYAEAARDLVPHAAVTIADVVDVDDFVADLIYLYRPAVSDALEDEIERHVVDRMAAGAVLFLPCRRPSDVLPLAHLGGEIWRRV